MLMCYVQYWENGAESGHSKLYDNIESLCEALNVSCSDELVGAGSTVEWIEQ